MILLKYSAIFLITVLSANLVTCFKKSDKVDADDKKFLNDNFEKMYGLIGKNSKDMAIHDTAHEMAASIERAFNDLELPKPPLKAEQIKRNVDLATIKGMCETLMRTYEGSPSSQEVPKQARAIQIKIAEQLREKISAKSSTKSPKAKV